MARKKEVGKFVYCGGCKKMRNINDFGVDDRTRRPVREAECKYCGDPDLARPEDSEDRFANDDLDENGEPVPYLDTISSNALPSKESIERFAHAEKVTTYRLP